MSKPQFIYFDMGNVLLLFDHQLACEQIGRVAGITADKVRQVVFDSELQSQYETGQITSRQFYDSFCRLTETAADYDQLLLAASDIFTLNTPIIPLLVALHDARIRIGILSNTCDAHWQFARRRFSILEQYFCPLALSFEVKSMKPDSAIYHAAADLTGVAINDIFFTDDREENIQAAHREGMQAVQFTTARDLAGTLRGLGLRFNY
ncbi:MAG: HAD superfamily hydrolase (TIGR01509 family) [Pirellulaceae bacterium]|jgi:HAD superfamily hydrolase (TIGR01509 family)